MPSSFYKNISTILQEFCWVLRDDKWFREGNEYVILTNSTVYISTTVDGLTGWTNFSRIGHSQLSRDSDGEFINEYYQNIDELYIAITAYLY